MQMSFVVSVVLTPLSSGHTLARTFTLSEDHPDFEIGRSSKRDVKNRSPASDNGWFDSGVMSRTHAKFSLEEKVKSLSQDTASSYAYHTSSPARLYLRYRFYSRDVAQQCEIG